MKILPTLMVTSLLAAGSALATAAETPTATPATATPVAKHNSTAHCEKLAHEKKLKGDDEKQFVKECRAGKKA